MTHTAFETDRALKKGEEGRRRRRRRTEIKGQVEAPVQSPSPSGPACWARKTAGPGVDVPGPASYDAFRREDPRCGPTVLRKLRRRIKAIAAYLERHNPPGRRNPLTQLMAGYARQMKMVQDEMARANIVFVGRDESKDADSDEEGNEDDEAEEEEE